MSLRRFSIGYRTVKTALGTMIAIAIAQGIGLDYYVSAGILTILCIQQTRKKSFHAVYTRVVASLIGMLYSYIIFENLGYHAIWIGLMLLIFIPTLVTLKVEAGFVSSAVIILHVFNSEHFTWALLQNELMLMTIGFGTGLAVNMYMEDITIQLEAYRIRIESLYSAIFLEVAKYLREGDTLWDGYEIIEAEQTLREAKSVAFKDVENHLTRLEDDYYLYFDMREKQLEIIERVLPKVTALPVIVQEAELVADFLTELAGNVHSGDTTAIFRTQLEAIKEDFASMTLPQTHEQFLAQAAFYQFIEEMENYLVLKHRHGGL